MLEKKAEGKSLHSRLRKCDLWGLQPTSGEAVNSFSMTFAPILSRLGQRRARQQTQARRLEEGQAVLPTVSSRYEKDRKRRYPWGRRGALGRTHGRPAGRPRTWRPAPHSPQAGSGKRRLPPITASTAPCQVPAPASKFAAQTPRTHWKVGPGPGPGPAPGIRRVSQGLGGGGGWEAISPPAPLRLRPVTATAR